MASGSIRILYPDDFAGAAKEVRNIYPAVKREIESFFEWPMYAGTTILVVTDTSFFLHKTGNPLIVAFAVPEKQLIVLDYSRISKHPFSLRTTLKHECCHLLLHTHIAYDLLPRWLDEGLCQWISGGVDEILIPPGRSRLSRAVLSDRLFRFRELHRNFPADTENMILAYEQSKSFVSYLFSKYGKDQVRSVLEKLKSDQQVSTAMQSVFTGSAEEIENAWHQSLKLKTSWFTFLSAYLYEFLFIFMAILTLIGYVRYLSKKKRMNIDDEHIMGK